MGVTTTPIKESVLFSDEPRMIAELLREEWSLGPDDTPTIAYIPEEYMTSARVAFIYVYQISRYNSVSSTDYRTLQRTSFLAIRINTRFRQKLYEYMQEIYRIAMANRRLGQSRLGGFTYFEVINDRVQNDLSGWNSATMDIKLISYNYPLNSAGFGKRVNKALEEYTESIVSYSDEESDAEGKIYMDGNLIIATKEEDDESD